MAEHFESDREFMSKVEPIIANEAFARLKNTQHHNDSVYNHTLRVAYLAFRIGKRVSARETELVRGALFHDLYYHNWREKEYILKHGWVHPKIALANARKHFSPLTEREENIISSHMWPFNIGNPPRFREALIVSFSDKVIATGEVILMFLNFVKRKFARSQGEA